MIIYTYTADCFVHARLTLSYTYRLSSRTCTAHLSSPCFYSWSFVLRYLLKYMYLLAHPAKRTPGIAAKDLLSTSLQVINSTTASSPLLCSSLPLLTFYSCLPTLWKKPPGKGQSFLSCTRTAYPLIPTAASPVHVPLTVLYTHWSPSRTHTAYPLVHAPLIFRLIAFLPDAPLTG